jgi:transposase InsO family protein
VHEQSGSFVENIACGVKIRHDHRSQFVSDDFRNEVAFLGIASSPAFVREPEGNGCIERFFRTRKEQLLWLRDFTTLENLARHSKNSASGTTTTGWWKGSGFNPRGRPGERLLALAVAA